MLERLTQPDHNEAELVEPIGDEMRLLGASHPGQGGCFFPV